MDLRSDTTCSVEKPMCTGGTCSVESTVVEKPTASPPVVEELKMEQKTITPDQKACFLLGFQAITTFIKDLAAVHSTKKISPLILYNRLITHIRVDDYNAIVQVNSGFKSFFNKYQSKIDTLDIPVDVTIPYGNSSKVYLEIGRFVAISTEDVKTNINKHLLTIAAIFEPDRAKADELEEKMKKLDIDDTTSEGEFLNKIMKKAKQVSDSTNMNTPQDAISGMLSSGILNDLFDGLHKGVDSGRFNPAKLIGMMTGVMGEVMPEENARELSNIVKGIGGKKHKKKGGK